MSPVALPQVSPASTEGFYSVSDCNLPDWRLSMGWVSMLTQICMASCASSWGMLLSLSPIFRLGCLSFLSCKYYIYIPSPSPFSDVWFVPNYSFSYFTHMYVCAV